jgi:hypothetical protein
MGGGAGVSATLSGARGLRIVLREVRRDWIDLGELARYLESGTGPGSQHVSTAARDGRLYVVTAVLKSSSFATVVDRGSAQRINAQAALAGQVDVQVRHSTDRTDAAVIEFTGPTPLAFAFQAIRLVYEDDVYTDFVTAHGLRGFELPGTTELPLEGMLLLEEDLAELA